MSAVLNGAGGVVSFAGPALLSSVWFPLDQRATATGIASFANYFGMAMSFIIGVLCTADIYNCLVVTVWLYN